MTQGYGWAENWWMVDPCPVIVQAWWNWHPPVGSWIALLAFFGVIVPWLFRPLEKMGRGEKAFWTVVMLAFLGLEIRTLYLDRDEHDRGQAHVECEQLERFRTIAGGLQSSIDTSKQQYSSTIDHVNAVLDKTQEAASAAEEGIASMTGTDSYLLAIPQHSFPPTPANQDTFGFSISPVGKHIVWDGEVSESEGVLDDSFYSRPQKVVELKPISNSRMSGLGITIQPSKEKENWYAFGFSSRATAGGENLQIRFNKESGKWEFRFWLYRMKSGTKKPQPPVLVKQEDWKDIPSPMLVGKR